MNSCQGISSYDNVIHVSPHQPVIMPILHKERVVAVAGCNFGITDVQFVVQQRSYDGARTLRGKAPVGSKRQYQEIRLGESECGTQVVVMQEGRVKIV